MYYCMMLNSLDLPVLSTVTDPQPEQLYSLTPCLTGSLVRPQVSLVGSNGPVSIGGASDTL